MGKAVKRYDVNIRADKIEVTPQGFLRIPVYAARTGVQVYRRSDGTTIREYRPKEEVFSEKTMRSLAALPITNEHPKEMINPTNAKTLMVGYTSDVVKNVQDQFLATDAIIIDKDSIEDVKAGKVQVSMGYDVMLEDIPGEFEGERYDVVQRNIVHNHMAIVTKGRGGPDVRLRLDSDDAVTGEIEDSKKGGTTMKVKLGATEFDVAEELGNAIAGLQKDYDDAKKQIETFVKKDAEIENTRKDESDKSAKKDAEIDALKAEIAKRDAVKVSDLVKARVNLEGIAAKHLDKEEIAKLGTMSDVEIMKAVILTQTPDVKFDDKSDVYIQARFDHIADLPDSADVNGKVGDQLARDRKDAENADLCSEKKKMESMKADTEAWKKPVGRQGEKSGIKVNS